MFLRVRSIRISFYQVPFCTLYVILNKVIFVVKFKTENINLPFLFQVVHVLKGLNICEYAECVVKVSVAIILSLISFLLKYL